MIARLNGTVVQQEQTHVIIEAAGVGYIVGVIDGYSYELNQTIIMHIQTIYRENDVQLYGFDQPSSKQLFNILTSVQGVGCKHAMNILKIGDIQHIVGAISNSEATILTSADGVGPKLASRIINELHNKIAKQLSIDSANINNNNKVPHDKNDKNQYYHDAIAALISLGFSRPEALHKVTTANNNNNITDLNELIRQSLVV